LLRLELIQKDYIQDFLKFLSGEFISEYLVKSQRLETTYSDIWKLKEKYLKKLYDSIKSRHKRTLIKREKAEKKQAEIEALETKFPGLKSIVSLDPKLNDIKLQICNLASFSRSGIHMDILLNGERGTGKDLFAKVFHEASGRQGEFISVNCSAISEKLFEAEFFGYLKGAFTGANTDTKGLFEQADGGTIFLDEIGDLDFKFQPKLLRVFQEREIRPVGSTKTKTVDVRIVLATNRDLEKMVIEGIFRADLYDRIRGFDFNIPPLSHRKNDVPLLIDHFIQKHDVARQKDPKLAPFRISKQCLDFLKNHEWEGNIRELESLVRRIVTYRSIDKCREEISEFDFHPHFFHKGKPVSPSKKSSKRGSLAPYIKEAVRLVDEKGMTKKAVADRYGVRRETVPGDIPTTKKKS